MRGFPKAEPGENKGDTGLLTGLGIAVGVSDVNWVRDGVAFYDETDIFGLVFAAAARTFVVEEAVAKTSGLQKGLDVAGLTVADDVKGILLLL